MVKDLYSSLYNPDVLSCLANLSNDEVFTPPAVANQMLDLLPQELFADPDAKFLDPACKSGIFLREIAKRLLTGLEPVFPDLQQRVDHIFQQQLYGIAITELTSLLSRRSVYCSKYPNSIYSVSQFNQAEGRIRFKRTPHHWQNGRCAFCGASQGQYDRGEVLETHAYELIHTPHPEEIFNMKFDVIIGNPPYQLSDGGNAASAMPIYQKFVRQAQKLNPRYLTMIIPSRWFTGGRGLDAFRDDMLHDERIRVLHDFVDASDCFPGVEIKGGVCYFLWDRDNKGLCKVFSHQQIGVVSSERPLLEKGMDTFIRSPEQVSIIHKIRSFNEDSLTSILNAGRFFGFHTRIDWENKTHGYIQTADGKSTIPVLSSRSDENCVKVYVHKGVCWISRNNIPKNVEVVDKYKVIIPRSGNPGSTILGKPRISEPGSCSSNSYVVAYNPQGENSQAVSENLLRYFQTKFLRFLVAIKTVTQDMAPKAYDFVPIQDFQHAWTDEELYKKYNLSESEIALIEFSIPTIGTNDGEDDGE